jgi:predicted metalloprotease with PDZ domain
VPDGGFLHLGVAGETILGDRVNRVVALRAGEASKSPGERLAGAGLQLRETAGEVQVLAVAFGSSAAKAGIRAGWTIRNVLVAADRPAKEWMFIPALVVLGAVVAIQRRRRTR